MHREDHKYSTVGTSEGLNQANWKRNKLNDHLSGFSQARREKSGHRVSLLVSATADFKMKGSILSIFAW